MSYGVYANQEPFSGTASSLTTIDLKRKSRKVMILNDSSSLDLQYKFNLSEEWATLKGTETFSAGFTTKTIYLSGIGVPFRVWSLG